MIHRASALLGALLFAACSAITSTDTDQLYPAGDGADAGPGTIDAGPRDTGAPPGRDAGPPPGRDAGPPPERDAGPPPERDAGPPPERDAGPPPRTVPCGDMACPAGSEHGCCFPERAEPYCYDDGAGVSCDCEGTFCDITEAQCNGASDCPGEQVCCAYWGWGDELPRRIICVADCSGGTISDAREVCDPSAAGACGGDADCHRVDRLPAGYGVCEG